MKRLISLALAIALLLTMGTQVAMADEDRKSGAFTYRIKGNGTAAIIGYDWSSKEIYIPRMLDGYTVTEISESAFSDFVITDYVGTPYDAEQRKIKSLVIPDTVTYIGERAFMGNSIESISISIPASVQFIGAGAFSAMFGLEKFVVDKNNTTYATIDGVLFQKANKELICYPLSQSDFEYKLPEGIRKIGDYAYYGADLSMAEALCSSVTEIGKYAFCKAYMNTEHIRESEDQIGRGKYSDVFRLPDQVTKIGEGCFYEFNPSLTSSSCDRFDLSNTRLTEVPSYAFYGSTAHKIALPDTIETIGEKAFANSMVWDVKMPPNLKYIKSGAFENSSVGSFESLTLPDGLLEIGNKAFYSDDPLLSISGLAIPASVETLGDEFCNRVSTTLTVEPGSYAAIWASENGYITQGDDSEDTSWLN